MAKTENPQNTIISGNSRENAGVTVGFPVRISAVLQPIVTKRFLALTARLNHKGIIKIPNISPIFPCHFTLYDTIRTLTIIIKLPSAL
jgi:hypothetical protein